jgi:hypothetical protein
MSPAFSACDGFSIGRLRHSPEAFTGHVDLPMRVMDYYRLSSIRYGTFERIGGILG